MILDFNKFCIKLIAFGLQDEWDYSFAQIFL